MSTYDAKRPIRRALISVYDKTGLVDLARGLDALVQGLFVVIVEHRNGLLGKYRAGVGAGVHQVHRAPGDFGAVGQRIGHPVRARECRQQSRMGVEGAAYELRKKF